MPHPNDSYFARRRRKAARLEGGHMQVIGGKNRPAALLEPGIDFLTESAPQQSAGERVIDTGYDFVPGAYTRLNGRKYVNEETVKALAGLIGWVDGDAARAVQAEFDAYKAKVADLVATLDGIGERVADVIAAAVPAPNSVSVTPPPDAEAQADIADARAAAESAALCESEQAKAAAAATTEEVA